MSVVDKFLSYVVVDTQSNQESETIPSTEKQLVLSQQLYKEVKAMGIENAWIGEAGNVYGCIEANCEGKKAIGLLAHMDTATEASGYGVNPRIIKNYQGEVIQLNPEHTMSTDEFPPLKTCIGEDIIVTDGTTLLGGDDKAGIAIIMQTVEEIINSDAPHGKIMFAFTSDEEVGRGADYFEFDNFPVNYAYTLDGGEIEQVDYENFNAAMAIIDVHGVIIHPGEAKGLMINPAIVASEFVCAFPELERPEHTEMREGFYHFLSMEAGGDSARIKMIIRDHDTEKFEARKAFVQATIDRFNEKYDNRLDLNMFDQYRNMAQFITDNTCIERAYKAVEKEGFKPASKPVRGGTDGARLTENGLICPNLGTGSYNHHGAMEFANITEMNLFVEVLYAMLTKIA